MEVKDKEIIDLKDRYLRSVADFRNLQDRTKRDVQAARDFAIQRFAKDLIESIDNLDRALETVPAASLNLSAATDSSSSSPSTSAPDSSSPASESSTTSSPSPSTSRSAPNKDLVNLYDGLKMTSTILMQTLGKHGLVRFDPSEKENQRFDPNLHEATFQTPVEGREDGTVFHTQQKGFLLNGRVLRAAKVGVVKNA
ncbi:MAG: Mitochondrial matrix cochaperone [Caeruleum heppii]|nr:MAG: Mitochondrial matrix cochaperone [Caeruleum heppii]